MLLLGFGGFKHRLGEEPILVEEGCGEVTLFAALSNLLEPPTASLFGGDREVGGVFGFEFLEPGDEFRFGI